MNGRNQQRMDSSRNVSTSTSTSFKEPTGRDPAFRTPMKTHEDFGMPINPLSPNTPPFVTPGFNTKRIVSNGSSNPLSTLMFSPMLGAFSPQTPYSNGGVQTPRNSYLWSPSIVPVKSVNTPENENLSKNVNISSVELIGNRGRQIPSPLQKDETGGLNVGNLSTSDDDSSSDEDSGDEDQTTIRLVKKAMSVPKSESNTPIKKRKSNGEKKNLPKKKPFGEPILNGAPNIAFERTLSLRNRRVTMIRPIDENVIREKMRVSRSPPTFGQFSLAVKDDDDDYFQPAYTPKEKEDKKHMRNLTKKRVKKKKRLFKLKKKPGSHKVKKSSGKMEKKYPRRKSLKMVESVKSRMCEKELRKRLKQTRSQKRRLPTGAVEKLKTWFVDNMLNPYPSGSEKKTLMKNTGLTKIQLDYWFTNKRKRVWRHYVEELSFSK